MESFRVWRGSLSEGRSGEAGRLWFCAPSCSFAVAVNSRFLWKQWWPHARAWPWPARGSPLVVARVESALRGSSAALPRRLPWRARACSRGLARISGAA